MAATDVEDEEGAGREEAVVLELGGDCDGGGAAEDEAASESDAEGKTEVVAATEEEGLGEGWLWLLFRE